MTDENKLNEKVDVEVIKNNNNVIPTLEQAIKEIHNWQSRYNEVAKVNNYHVSVIQGMLEFLQIQSGILYTALTKQPKCDNPLEKLSVLQETTLDKNGQDLNFLRNIIITFTSALIEKGNIEYAKEVWQEFIKTSVKSL